MITVIGAGPAGLRTAELLAKQGREVVVLERSSSIGLPVQCTGIVTPSIKDILQLKKDFVVNRLKRVAVHAPDGTSADIKSGDFVIDRVKFDRHLAERARRAGAKIFLNKEVNAIVRKSRQRRAFLKVKDTKTKKIRQHKTDILIGADGPASIVSKKIGNPRPNFWIGKQARVKIPVGKFTKDAYHVYFGKDFPGFFGWVVPESGSVARVGVAVAKKVDGAFKRVMKRIGKHKVLEIQGGLIPRFNPHITVQDDEVYLLGDAATQVKATTGGGLVPGLKAAACLARAIKEGTDYHAELSAVNRELKTHLLIRNIMDRFKDADYNRLVQMMGRQGLKKALARHDRDHATMMLLSLLVHEPSTLMFSKVLFQRKQL